MFKDKCSSSNGISNSSAQWYVHNFDENFVSKSFRKLKTTFIIMLESGLTCSVKSEGVKKVNCEAQRWSTNI